MGLKIPPLPDDYGAGLDCLDCHPAGKAPNYVFVRFWDITACPGKADPPNGYTFICAQDPLTPCNYLGELDFGGVHWHCYYHSCFRLGAFVYSELILDSIGEGWPSHFGERTDPCTVDFSNPYTTCPGWGGGGGHAHVQVFVPPIIIALTSHLHFVTQPKPLYEIQDVGMDHQLVHLASRYDKTNVLIYIDSQEVTYP